MATLFSFLFSMAILFSWNAHARGLSAKRHTGESFQAAYNRVHAYNSILEDESSDDSMSAVRVPPAKRKKSLRRLNIQEIPELDSVDDLEAEFQFVRDNRFLQTDDPTFPRRLTWLYPDDGCYARAEMASKKLIAQNFPKPKKIFVFGNLTAKTGNATSGSVNWWYHVAVTYRVGDTAYVLDPAINPQHPMKLTEWNQAVGGDQTSVKYAICSNDTFDPDSDCLNPAVMSEAQAEAEQKGFLPDEWDRLLELNRDPTKELGQFPPWLMDEIFQTLW